MSVHRGELVSFEIETEAGSGEFKKIGGTPTGGYSIDIADKVEFGWTDLGNVNDKWFKYKLMLVGVMKSKKWARRRARQRMRMMFKDLTRGNV